MTQGKGGRRIARLVKRCETKVTVVDDATVGTSAFPSTHCRPLTVNTAATPTNNEPPRRKVDDSTSSGRIIDANLNRASEGLRVIEDYFRFGVDDPVLAKSAKHLRHQLRDVAARQLDLADLVAFSRDTVRDVGRPIKTAQELARADADDVLAANFHRLQQSLRSLEEWGKLVNPRFSTDIEHLRYESYVLESQWQRRTRTLHLFDDIDLCVLIDGGTNESDFASRLSELIAAGVPLVQLRVKQTTDDVLWQRAACARQLTQATSTRLIINDRADVAAAVEADGVHLGQDDLPIQAARKVLKPRQWIGTSTHSLTQVQEAIAEGADYLGLGPTFPSPTKAFDQFPGLAFLRQSADVHLPAFAIGGINHDRLPDVLSTGIRRIAVSAAVWSAPHVGEAARRFLSTLRTSAAEADRSMTSARPHQHP